MKVSRVKGLITIALVVVLLLNTGAALAESPAGRTTGQVTLGPPLDGWYANFSAHEAKNGRLAKGSILIRDDEGRELEFDVKYVKVRADRNLAWFAAQCTPDSLSSDDPDYKVGQWLFVKVKDGGTPGSKTDHMGWEWCTNEKQAERWVKTYGGPTDWCKVIKGNLRVRN